MVSEHQGPFKSGTRMWVSPKSLVLKCIYLYLSIRFLPSNLKHEVSRTGGKDIGNEAQEDTYFLSQCE